MEGIEIKQQPVQAQRISHEQLQAATILQMNSEELAGYLREQYEENPALELAEPEEASTSIDVLRYANGWSSVRPKEKSFDELTGRDEPGQEDPAMSSLSFFLNDQLARLRLHELQEKLVRYFILLLDEEGFLPEEAEKCAEEFCLPAEEICAAIRTLQSLDPPGVGARSAAERILLQIKRRHSVTEQQKRLISEHLPQLAKRKYAALAVQLSMPEEDVRALHEEITSLDPFPCAEHAPDVRCAVVTPDFFVIDDEKHKLHVIMNGSVVPTVSVSSFYESLLQDTADPDTAQYLRDKIRRAGWTVTNVQRRGALLAKCAGLICSEQRAFFLSGSEATICPMTVSEGARLLNVHVSVMSRAVKEKYLECRYGVFPLKKFFCKAVNGMDCTEHQIKSQLQTLVRREDRKKPLSDAGLAQRMAEMGYVVSRRTVNKYRRELGIGSASERRCEAAASPR